MLKLQPLAGKKGIMVPSKGDKDSLQAPLKLTLCIVCWFYLRFLVRTVARCCVKVCISVNHDYLFAHLHRGLHKIFFSLLSTDIISWI